ncbi:hypothetical protein [Streptomyces sp. WAC01280]|uniref:DUF7302 family protein n=1 Tax=Streptomyces sp. WAC01280 TaxID=2487424 RepID=UPI000F78546B|nr:hypothetical protein [Streptomyces sp. WAC01280]RSS51371.1 hypothetical protein EF909_34320 [Streptomyces sp. WAC01280]
MQIRMRTTMPGTRHGAPWPDRGETCDVPDDEAEQLIRYGAAEPVELAVEAEPSPPEAAKPARKSTRSQT